MTKSTGLHGLSTIKIEAPIKRVAIYIRCSSDEAKKEGYSPETQEEKVREFIKLNNYHLDEKNIYSDIGFSGSIDKRPGLQRLLTDAKNKEFDIVAVYRMDRFFRNLRLLLNTVADLRAIGIEFKSATEPFDTSTPAGRAMFSNAGVFAEWMREVGMESRNEGMIKAMKDGKWLGSAPYGYNVDKEKQRLEKKESEAENVRKIFNWFVKDEMTLYQIQKKVNSEGMPTKYDNLGKEKAKNKKGWWCKRAIGRTMRNETYSGHFYYRKYIDSSKIGSENNLRPQEEWIKIDTPEIISPDLFERAQKQLEKNKELSKRRTKKTYLLQHKIVCGHDGRKWQSACRGETKTWREVKYYFCSGTRKDVASNLCPSHSISESRIGLVVWETLMNLLTEPKTTMKCLKKYQEQKDKKPQLEEKLKLALKQLEINEDQKKRSYKAFVMGGIDENQYKNDLDKINRERINLSSEKQRLSQILLTEEEQDKRTKSIEELYAKIKTDMENADYNTKYAAIQRFIGKITVRDEEADIEFDLPTEEFSPCFTLSDGARMD